MSIMLARRDELVRQISDLQHVARESGKSIESMAIEMEALEERALAAEKRVAELEGKIETLSVSESSYSLQCKNLRDNREHLMRRLDRFDGAVRSILITIEDGASAMRVAHCVSWNNALHAMLEKMSSEETD